MAPIITLTTDFGTRDGYVGAVKGKIISRCPEARIINITHDISPQSILQAAFSIKRSVPYFPKKSIHVVVVDPGVGSFREALLVKTKDYYFIAPDNGVLSIILEEFPAEKIISIYPETDYWRTHTSFDGRELFAPVAAHLAAGMPLYQIGEEIENYEKISIPEPVKHENIISGEILLFDRFGNAITNISVDILEEYPISNVRLDDIKLTLPFQTHYQDGVSNSHGCCAIINSDELLEIAAYSDSIRDKFNLYEGDEVTVTLDIRGRLV